MEENFSKNDLNVIKNKGINIENVIQQFNFFKNGIPKINLDRPALLNDGVLPLSETNANEFANFFDDNKNNFKIKKFVPASGAASRMFKFLSEFLMDFKFDEETINAYINRKKDKNLNVFLVAKEKFPFYTEVILKLKNSNLDYSSWNQDKKDFEFIKTLLSIKDFNFSNKPKGILPFHKYENHTATAIEEHLNECTFYANSKSKSFLHFTVSEEHLSDFKEIVKTVKEKIEEESGIKIKVGFSFQDESTDIIASKIDNEPLRDESENLIFRPGGHGALIENLNALDADIIFVKNIDNVIQNHIETIALYKKALAGILLKNQNIIFDYLKLLENAAISDEKINEILSFLNIVFSISVSDDFEKYTKESKIDYLNNYLNRPIRVCGMVKNEGEPGGGPFWVFDKKGNSFLQIIEAAQIDIKDENQLKILQQSTHFNPVDLVCGTKDYKGNNFDLLKFIDKNTGFIVEKAKNGKPYKAYELPGLWNGAMAKWLTIFVEVPLITFNPVKTVNDLLKPAHQSPN